MHVDWDNTVVTGISGIKIEMPTEAKLLIITDNGLTHINDDHFEINYDDPHANVTDQLIPSTSASATASAPPFSFTA